MARKKMRYSLARYIGSGTEADPFRPAGVGGFDTWSAIDLRPDPTVAAGFAIIATPTPPPNLTGVIDSLGDDLDDLGLATRLLLQNRLGITLSIGRPLRRHIRDILTEHARTDGTRWRPLQPERINGGRAHAWRVRLGGEVIDEVPVVAGGATIAEDFNQADSTTLGPDLTWAEVSGNLQTVGNEARVVTLGATNYARAEHDLDSDDHYAQVSVITLSAPTNQVIACALTRFASAAHTCYRYTISNIATDHTVSIAKVVTGSVTTISSSVGISAPSLPVTLRGEANGSSLRLLLGGSEQVSITDTAISGNVRAGFALFVSGALSAGNSEIDNFQAGDLDVTVAGNKATETDTANTGAPAVVVVGQRATETDTPNAGTPAVVVAGQRADETNTANAGSGLVVIGGGQPTETDTPNAGTVAVIVAGQRADETDTATPGLIAVLLQGATATETNAGLSGVPTVVYGGALATETDTANAGASSGGQVDVAGDRRGCEPGDPTSRRGLAAAAATSRRGNDPATPSSRRDCP